MSEVDRRRIDAIVAGLTVEEQLMVVERVAHRVRERIRLERPQADLYGLWRNRFPADFDVDATLREIRSEWEHQDDTGRP